MELVHAVFVSVGDEPWWLGHVDLLEISVQERRFNIHVMNFPATVCRQSEDETHRLEPCHRCEHLLEVHTWTLHVALSDKSGLMLDYVPMLIFLHLINPFEADRTVACRERGESPGVVVIDGLKLFQHRTAPTILAFCLSERCGFFPCHEVQYLVVKQLLCRLRSSGRSSKQVIDEPEPLR